MQPSSSYSGSSYSGSSDSSMLLFALNDAARSGNMETLHELIAAGVDVNTPALRTASNSYKGCTALMAAAQGGQAAAVQALLAADADLTATTGADTTACMIAAAAGHTNIVQILLAAGAGLEDPDYQNRTALMYAAGAGHTATVQALIAAGANINATDDSGRTALHEAAAYSHTTTVQALVAAGADLNMARTDGTTALSSAVSHGNAAAARVLLEAGADANVRTVMNGSVLCCACTRGDLDTVKVLLPHCKNNTDLVTDAVLTAAMNTYNPRLQKVGNFLLNDLAASGQAAAIVSALLQDSSGTVARIAADTLPGAMLNAWIEANSRG